MKQREKQKYKHIWCKPFAYSFVFLFFPCFMYTFVQHEPSTLDKLHKCVMTASQEHTSMHILPKQLHTLVYWLSKTMIV